MLTINLIRTNYDEIAEAICEQLCAAGVGDVVNVHGLKIKAEADGSDEDSYRGCGCCCFRGYLGFDCFLNENGNSVVPCSHWNNAVAKPLVFKFVNK